MRIRRAILEDAEQIAKVHVDSWRTTYKNIIPQAFLDGLSYSKRIPLWEMNLSRPENYVLVAENEHSQIVGFADTSKRAENVHPNSLDLTSIYLLEEYQGQGIGRALLQELFAYYKSQKVEKVFVEVLADNKTKYFYEAFGAKHLRDIEIKIAGKLLKESIYVWNLREDRMT
ncbi:GNAT family N-acetyltransferase [Chryseomicrobium sp. FSL W7-1435]|uniref:GNAT family N-acetyltransferase n=1 Tax=Chryseomicrobium sp. FSL W7-1435 TaxID=2921704 RepID=UPI00315A99C7